MDDNTAAVLIIAALCLAYAVSCIARALRDGIDINEDLDQLERRVSRLERKNESPDK